MERILVCGVPGTVRVPQFGFSLLAKSREVASRNLDVVGSGCTGSGYQLLCGCDASAIRMSLAVTAPATAAASPFYEPRSSPRESRQFKADACRDARPTKPFLNSIVCHS